MLKLLNKLASAVARNLYFIVCLFNPGTREDYRMVELSILSKKLKNRKLMSMVLLAEDKRFFEHGGIDMRAIVRASYRSIFCNRLEGGSTIEQQYVRLITNKRNISLIRKIRECVLAARLSHAFSKGQILNSYLLRYRFVDNVQGIEELARGMRIDLDFATFNEMGLIVARLKYPFARPDYPFLIQRAAMISRLIISAQAPRGTERGAGQVYLSELA